MPFTEDRGIDFRINTGLNLSGTSETIIKIKYPDDDTDTWECTIYDETNGIIRYISSTTEDELDYPGTWQIQAKITFATGEIYHGSIASFIVSEVLIPTEPPP